jgi:cysteine desulfurase
MYRLALVILLVLSLLFIPLIWYWIQGIEGLADLENSKKIYLDNNATTKPHPEVIKAVAQHANLGNASNSDAARRVLAKSSQDILEGLPNRRVIFTSGASESNNLFLRGMVDAFHLSLLTKPSFSKSSDTLPHLIIADTEHKTSIECVKQLAALDRAEITLLPCRNDGTIDPMVVAYAIKPNTIVISVMHVNNETGGINDIASIGKIAAAHNITFHTDIVQSYAKLLNPEDLHDIDALSVSFHKIHGPTGVGALIIKPRLIPILQKAPQISGSQNEGIRGGTENIAGIAGAATAVQLSNAAQISTYQHVEKLKNMLVTHLLNQYKLEKFSALAGTPDETEWMGPQDGKVSIIFLGPITWDGTPDRERSSPYTLLVSFIKHSPMASHFCNIQLQKDLNDAGAIVSIGSACNGGAPSHVLKAMRAPFIVRCGVIRISPGAYNTEAEIKKFCQLLDICVAKQLI